MEEISLLFPCTSMVDLIAYFSNSLVTLFLIESLNLKFNNQKFAYFKLKESHFLLNKYTHLSYEIDEKIKEIIFSNKKNKFESKLIEDCIENNILI